MRSITRPMPGASPMAVRSNGTRDNGPLRGGVFDAPIVPNSTELDPTFGQFQMVGEIERRYDLWGQPGKVLVTGYLARGRMGSFRGRDRLGRGQRAVPPIPPPSANTKAAAALASIWSSRSPPMSASSCAPAGPTAILSRTNSPTSTAPSPAGLRSPASNGAGRTTRSGSPASSTGFQACIRLISTPGLGILVGDGSCRIPGLEQIIEAYYSYALTPDASDLRLSVHQQPGLQQGSRPGECFRRPHSTPHSDHHHPIRPTEAAAL